MILEFFQTEYEIRNTFIELSDFLKSKNTVAYEYFNANEGEIYSDLIDFLKRLTQEETKTWSIKSRIRLMLSVVLNMRHDILYQLTRDTQFELTGLFIPAKEPIAAE